jgi:hypothetical protein
MLGVYFKALASPESRAAQAKPWLRFLCFPQSNQRLLNPDQPLLLRHVKVAAQIRVETKRFIAIVEQFRVCLARI